jgi:hypothetical protein
MWKWAVFGLVLLLALPAAAEARDIYVKAGASGKGTMDSPYGNLWKALSKAMRGDVIHVAEGVYEGKGGAGAFTIQIPGLTLAGGYKGDFSERNPFKYKTILQRAKDYRGDWTGLPEGIIEGKATADHSKLIVDGFVLNSFSRNAYHPSGDINPKKSWKGALFRAYSPDCKVRNCILLNPYGNGIYWACRGKENEISNTLVLNTFYAGISTRAAQDESVCRIKNCTVAFSWFQPGKGGGQAVFVGRQGQTIMENNIFSMIQTEGGSAGFAVNNGFGNEDTVLKGNVFFQCQGGYYKYKDDEGKNLLIWKKEELDEISEDSEEYMLSEAEGNTEEDPGWKPEKDYFEKFTNFVASQPGKLKMDLINKWRRAVGLPLQAEPGSKRKNFGMAYPLESVVPNLFSKIAGKGVQADGPFEKYVSKAAVAEKKEYKEVPFERFSKTDKSVPALKGMAVKFKAGMGPTKNDFLLKNAPRSDYQCVRLLMPGESDFTRKYVFGYLLKGSPAAKKWKKYFKKKDKYNKKGGIVIRGTAWFVGNMNYAYPVGIIIDKVSKK